MKAATGYLKYHRLIRLLTFFGILEMEKLAQEE